MRNNPHDKYIALVLELHDALLNASRSAPSAPHFVDVGDSAYFLSDIEWANSINPVLVTMCKVIECSKLSSQVGTFRAVRVPRLQLQNGPTSGRASLAIHRTNGRQTVELVSVSCDWNSMPFVRKGEFTYSVPRARTSALTTFAKWLSQDLFFLEADVNDAGRLVWGEVEPAPIRGCVTQQYSYSVGEFIRVYRNTIAAHLSPRGKGKRRLLGEIMAEGPYWFRWYAKLLTYALAQDLLCGLISSRHKKLRQIAGDEMFAVNIRGKVGIVGGLPENRFELVPQRLHVHGPQKAVEGG